MLIWDNCVTPKDSNLSDLWKPSRTVIYKDVLFAYNGCPGKTLELLLYYKEE